MELYGATFKKLRENKRLTIQEVSENLISSKSLTEFENNTTCISLSLLIKLLERINVTMNEFLILHSSITSTASSPTKIDSSQEKFWKEFVKVYYSADPEIISSLLEYEEDFFTADKHFRHKYNAILLNQLYLLSQNHPFCVKESNEIKNYLLNVEIWCIYELTLFNNSLFFLPIEDIEALGKAAIQKCQPFLKLEDNKNFYYNIMLNIISLLLKNDLFVAAKNYIDTIESDLFNTSAYFDRLRLSFLKGIFHIKIGRTALGRKLCTDAIKFSKIYDQSLGVVMQNELIDTLTSHSA